MSRLSVVVLLAAVVALPAGAASATRAGTITFFRSAPDGDAVFAVHPDGTDLRPLTPRSARFFAYQWSRDRRLIAYTDPAGSLWVERFDATRRRMLVSSATVSCLDVSWSPDGKEIAVLAAGPHTDLQKGPYKTSIYVVSIDGGQLRPLGGKAYAGNVAWSPRGDEIAYGDAAGGVWIVSPEGGKRRLIAHGGGPDWSPDGTQLAFGFAVHRTSGRIGRYAGIAVVRADGTGLRVLTRYADNEYGFAWSPDGTRIAYGAGDLKGLHVIDADGRDDHRVTRVPARGFWTGFAWSPDGRSIAYATYGTGNGDLYVVDADGRNGVQLTSTPDFDSTPSWVAP